jgi:uncharacterized protein (DUF433 family)
MTQVTDKVVHPYIASNKDFCGGSPVIRGTKVPVRSVVNYVLVQGLSAEELVKEFSHLTLAQVYDALSYYYDHKDDVDRELEELREDSLRAEKIG